MNIRDQQRYLREQNRAYGHRMQEVPVEAGATSVDGRSRPCRAWRSRSFLAVLWCAPSGQLCLSVNRTMIDGNGDWLDGITWDELLRVKSECGLGLLWGVEAYPPALEVMHDANMRHLFLFDSKPAWAWGRG